MDKSFKLSFLDVFLPFELADKGVLVGSRAQGVSKTQYADWDYMFLEEYKEEILNTLRNKGISFSLNALNGSIKFFVTLAETTYLINFIFIDKQETYNAWIKATEVLKIVGNAFTTKQGRIKAFCDLVVYFGGEPSKYPNFCS
jgi:hypothetical protein